MDVPVPPFALANRVGELGARRGYERRFDGLGRESRAALERILPDGWDWKGKDVLDFGCGPGRTLRQFAAEAAAGARFVGCDIDAESVDWIQRHLSPPFRVLANGPAPPLPVADAAFDLVYAFSVFTHLTSQWSAWLAELHRVLKPDGLLAASFLGEGMSEIIAHEPWDASRVGMNVLRPEQGWDRGGPSVLLSEWWLRDHWGRAFDILELQSGAAPGTHGMLLARRRPVEVDDAVLEAVTPENEALEWRAVRHNVRQAGRDVDQLQKEYESSSSWRITRPLRRAGGLIKKRRRS